MDEFFLHARTRDDVDAADRAENGTVLGVDIGIENIAITSTRGVLSDLGIRPLASRLREAAGLHATEGHSGGLRGV